VADEKKDPSADALKGEHEVQPGDDLRSDKQVTRQADKQRYEAQKHELKEFGPEYPGDSGLQAQAAAKAAGSKDDLEKAVEKTAKVGNTAGGDSDDS
jgi:hypothetical protein